MISTGLWGVPAILTHSSLLVSYPVQYLCLGKHGSEPSGSLSFCRGLIDSVQHLIFALVCGSEPALFLTACWMLSSRGSGIPLPHIRTSARKQAIKKSSPLEKTSCDLQLISERDIHGSQLRTDEEPTYKWSHTEVKVHFTLVWERSLCSPWSWSILVGSNLPL